MKDLPKHWNKDSKENTSKYHTGFNCIEKNCTNPAGTAWSPHWCWECNARRLDKIKKSIEDILEEKSDGPTNQRKS